MIIYEWTCARNAGRRISLLYSVEYQKGLKPYAIVMGIDSSTDDFKKNGKLVIPEKIDEYEVRDIRNFAFYRDQYIKEITIPDTITTLSDDLFRDSNLKSIHFGKNVKKIGQGTFFNCRLLTNIGLPEGLEAIYSDAFKKCANLTSMILPDSLTYLGKSAFDYCESLESIHIGAGLEDIQILSAFAYKCKNLNNITVSSSNEHFKTCGNALYNIDNKQLMTSSTTSSGGFL